MWLPAWRRNTKPARSRAARTSRPDRSVGSLATTRRRQRPPSRRLDLDEFLARLGRHGIAGVTAVLDIKRDRFPDIFQRFSACVALAHASRQRRHAGHIATILFPLQNDRVAHRSLPMGGTPPHRPGGARMTPSLPQLHGWCSLRFSAIGWRWRALINRRLYDAARAVALNRSCHLRCSASSLWHANQAVAATARASRSLPTSRKA